MRIIGDRKSGARTRGLIVVFARPLPLNGEKRNCASVV
jgi:hypothetical protein